MGARPRVHTTGEVKKLIKLEIHVDRHKDNSIATLASPKNHLDRRETLYPRLNQLE